MRNNKGFTLTEVLLAVMIIGIVGVALAALTGAAVRESSVGRTRMMLRNQLSVALRQLRQDAHWASEVACSGGSWMFMQSYQIDPGIAVGSVSYTSSCSDNICTITRNGEDFLSNVKQIANYSPKCSLEYLDSSHPTSPVLKLTFVLGTDSEPPVTETVEEILVLPHGF